MESISENGREIFTFEPWCNCTDDPTSCDICDLIVDHGYGNTNVGGVFPDEVWHEPIYLNDDIRWVNAVEVYEEIYAGYVCDWAADCAPKGQRKRLWNLIRKTSNLEWRLVTKHAHNIERFLPKDWERGYDQVLLGVSVETRRDISRIEILRTIPAARRIVEIEPLFEDLGVIDLTGICRVSVRPRWHIGSTPMESDWLINIHRQCLNQGVIFSSFMEDQYERPPCRIARKEGQRKAKEFEKNVWNQWKKRRAAAQSISSSCP